MYVIGHLATTTTMGELCSTLKAIQVVFGSKFVGPPVQHYLLLLQSAINGTEIVDEDDVVSVEDFVEIEVRYYCYL